MPDTATIGILAGIVSALAYPFYILSVVRSDTPPNRASWFIWLLVTALMLVSFDGGTRGADTRWVLVVYLLGSLVIAALSLRRGTGGASPLDVACLVVAIASIVPWLLFRSPTVTFLICLCVDVIGGIPTLRKVWYVPRSENRTAWALWALGNLINVFAVGDGGFIVAVYPVTMLILTTSVMVLTYGKVQKSHMPG